MASSLRPMFNVMNKFTRVLQICLRWVNALCVLNCFRTRAQLKWTEQLKSSYIPNSVHAADFRYFFFFVFVWLRSDCIRLHCVGTWLVMFTRSKQHSILLERLTFSVVVVVIVALVQCVNGSAVNKSPISLKK